MDWVYVVLAGLLEVAWVIGLKHTQGWTKLLPSVLTAAAMALSFWLLSRSLRTLPIGTAYAVWTGIGAVGAGVVGMVLFGEPRDGVRIACIGLIVVGIVGLKVCSH